MSQNCQCTSSTPNLSLNFSNNAFDNGLVIISGCLEKIRPLRPTKLEN